MIAPDVVDRIREAVTVADAVNIEPGRLAAILAGERDLEQSDLVEIARAADVTTWWIITGSGPVPRRVKTARAAP